MSNEVWVIISPAEIVSAYNNETSSIQAGMEHMNEMDLQYNIERTNDTITIMEKPEPEDLMPEIVIIRCLQLIGQKITKYCRCDPCTAENRKVSHKDRFVKHAWSNVQCPDCGAWYRTERGVNSHRTKVHPYAEGVARSKPVNWEGMKCE